MVENNTITGEIKENFIVQKTDPLRLIKNSFTLGEYKLLDVYLSRINSHDETLCTVKFTKEEYEQLMGLKECDWETLRRNAKSFMSNKVISIPVEEGFDNIILFSRAKGFTDKSGNKVIEITCSEEAKKYIFNSEDKLHYIRYELRNVIGMKSTYTYLLYMFLKNLPSGAKTRIGIDELRTEVFKCESDYYKDFRFFNRDILSKAVDEINKVTDVRCECEFKRKDRKVNTVIFTVTNKRGRKKGTPVLSSSSVSEKEMLEGEEYLKQDNTSPEVERILKLWGV